MTGKLKRDELPLDSSEFRIGDDGELVDLVEFEEEETPKRKNDETDGNSLVIYLDRIFQATEQTLSSVLARLVAFLIVLALLGAVSLLTQSGNSRPTSTMPREPAPTAVITAAPTHEVTPLSDVITGMGSFVDDVLTPLLAFCVVIGAGHALVVTFAKFFK